MIGDKKKFDCMGLCAYLCAAIISLFFLLKALVFRNEVSQLLHYLTAGPVFVLSVIRIFMIVLKTRRVRKGDSGDCAKKLGEKRG